MSGRSRAAGFDPGRLRAGEWIAGVAGLTLLVDLVTAPWYRSRLPEAGRPGVTGWRALTALRWPLLVTGTGGAVLAAAQGRCRAPAIPVATSGILTPVALVTATATLVRVLHPPRGSSRAAGAYVGLAAAVAVLAAATRSLRQEGILERDGPPEIPTLTV